MKHSALLAFGANLGDPLKTFQLVVDWLGNDSDFSNVRPSSPVATRPIGGAPQQPVFQNAAIAVETALSPVDIVQKLLEVETLHGRERAERWDARTIDLDLLLYDQQVIRTKHCDVPHPRMTFRRFMLEPAVEIAGDWLHPICRMTLRDLLKQICSTRPMVVSTLELPHALEEMIAEAGYQHKVIGQRDLDEIASATDPSQRPRLILIDSAQSHGGRGIPGPYLELGDVQPDRLSTEVKAALDAMEPLC